MGETCVTPECDSYTSKHCYFMGMGCHANSACDTSKDTCQCSDGYCADGHDCVLNSKTTCRSCESKVGTCRVWNCDKTRGATDCVHGICLCAEGTCALDGKCVADSAIPTYQCDVTTHACTKP